MCIKVLNYILELKISGLVLTFAFNSVCILVLEICQPDHTMKLFVEELTQHDSNLNCNLQCEICYTAIFIYADIGGCALYVQLAKNERIFSVVKHTTNKIPHSRLFSSKEPSTQSIILFL